MQSRLHASIILTTVCVIVTQILLPGTMVMAVPAGPGGMSEYSYTYGL